ncbi:MAG: GTPase domain-containing protein [Arenicellales bacterium]|nr:GTPase domain-containing protein [Arenicellales bacterium]
MEKRTNAGYLRAFLQQLDRTYQAQTSTTPSLEEKHFALSVATVGLDDWLIRHGRPSPLQVATIGPTQVGKSTVVNLLLGVEQAEVSPLAAYTNQLFGFAQTKDTKGYEWVNEVLGEPELKLHPVKSRGDLDSIIWDTPDFDSHRSHDYRALIAKICALVDVFVLVVSKEKYSDLSVWNTLKLLRPLNRRLIVCLNKVASDASILTEAVRSRLKETEWQGVDVPVIVLPYISRRNPFDQLVHCTPVDTLRTCVFDLANQCDHECRYTGVQSFIAENWDAWLQPVRGEVRAVNKWHEEVGQHVQEALTDYQEQYLNHSVHYDVFNQVVLRLLELLEIPGLGQPLTKLRKALTWPVRAVLGSFRQNKEISKETSEAAILEDIVEHALLSLHTKSTRHAAEPGQGGHWWGTLNRAYRTEAEAIRQRFPSAIDRYQQSFFPEIEKAADSIYTRLQENPVMLNTLRATRVSADIAAVVVAIKTGTMGISEALLTPAMLSVTSTLTEGAVGTYVGTIREHLKDHQYSLVQHLLRQELAMPLLELDLEGDTLFQIDERNLQKMERIRNELFV